MLAQPTEDEGAFSERPSKTQPTPSSSHLSEDPIEPQPDPSLKPSSSNLILDSIPEGSSGNHGDLKSQIKQLKKKAKHVISHHHAWIKSVSMKKRLARKKSLTKKLMHKESVSKQGRKPAKSEPTVHKDPAFDDFDDIVDYMETEDAQDEGRTSSKTLELSLSGDTVVLEEKESEEKGVSTEDPVSTAQPKVSTNKPKVSTDKPKVSTDKPKVSTDKDDEGTTELKDGNSDESATPTMTSTPTPTVFGDDETIAQVLITMSQNKVKQKEKEKGVEIKDTEDTDRPRTKIERSILTLKPLPKIDPKAKGKKKIEEEDESDTESEDITEAEKKFKMLANDEEIARKVQEEWEAEENKKRLAEEEATMAAFTNEYDFIQARLNADKILAEKLQEEEREKFTIEQRAKFLHDTIAAQRRFLAQQRSEAIRNKLPTRNQLRNQMMTYLKHVGGYKHAQLNKKKFEEIQVMYEKVKRENERFIPIGSAEDDKLIEKMNKKAAGMDKEEVAKELESSKVEGPKENIRKRSGRRLKMKAPKRSKKACKASDEDKEVDYEILDKKYPIKEWRSEYLTTKPQYDETEEVKYVYLNVVIRSNRQRRYFSTLMVVLSILDRDDICAIYQIVMNKYQDETPKGFDKILWGDLIIMFDQSDSDEFWNAQQNWKIYPLKKEVLSQLIELKLETEEDSTMALELIRFVKKQIAELEPKDSDGDEEDS
ncbi:hypothetical protein Tco_0691859 [Tanacetum coccineum]